MEVVFKRVRNELRSPPATNRTGRKRNTCTKSFLDPQRLDILGQIISSRFISTKADFHGHPSHKRSLLHEKARELFIWKLVLAVSQCFGRVSESIKLQETIYPVLVMDRTVKHSQTEFA